MWCSHVDPGCGDRLALSKTLNFSEPASSVIKLLPCLPSRNTVGTKGGSVCECSRNCEMLSAHGHHYRWPHHLLSEWDRANHQHFTFQFPITTLRRGVRRHEVSEVPEEGVSQLPCC